ncbi:hypothetical protein DPEC_G00307920 [Dallia pectoralis]|uniref:Uncharacterized protein n=1 Tax=Dallia pectoralis TaxID=75939 RepID=A0ACC2FEC6_DALPE|nr:hypothetical protein DPEC_G00307920 [Dallia pectoralis]
MMAGVVAMASVIEDFDTQSCKKVRKAPDTLTAKTITNYFSPVSKEMEKHFSPPRSNDITSYFSRKTSPVTEKLNIKANHLGPRSTEAPDRIDSYVMKSPKPPQKRGRKPKKAAQQLPVLDADAECNNDCVVVEEPGDGAGSEGKPKSSSQCILGSDTAALLAKFTVDVGMAGGTMDDNETVCIQTAPKEKHLKADSTNAVAAKKKGSCDSSPRIHLKNKEKLNKTEKKPCIEAKAKPQQDRESDVEECVSEVQEAPLSLSDAHMKVNPSEVSQLNVSTVTISYKDFLQSQGEPEQVDEEHKANELCLQQISPRTLTIQADVHSISPGFEPVPVTEKRMASIFSRVKGEGIPAAVESKSASSPCPQSRPELLPSSSRRRSNVVMQEEDLELDVLESDSSLKCNQVERKQFMSAFKQPAKPNKGPGKQPADKASGEAGKEVADNAFGDAGMESEDKASGDAGKEAVDKTSKKAGKEAVDKTSKKAGKEAVDKTSKKAGKEAVDKTSKKAGKEAEDKASGDAGKETADKTFKKVGKEAVDKTSKKAGEEAAEDRPKLSVPAEELSGKKAVKKKSPRRKREAQRKGAVLPPVTKEDPVLMETDMANTDAKPAAEPTTSTPTPVRRSPRDGPCREASLVSQTTPVAKTKKELVKAVDAVSEECLNQMTTPKPHRSKRKVFRAQMLCQLDDTTSPIRMKFTRVSSSAASECGIDLTSKESSASKKRKKAKKLVEKARAMKQSKRTSVHTEDQSSLRRSSRSHVSVKKSYNEDEDSVVFLDEESRDGLAQTNKEKSKVQKRSLNDVLGKKSPASKDARNSAGSKVAPMFLGKKSVISIKDDSSRDASDHSQDDEQFRARREFLKSGLPESFKRQMVKTAATQEAYTVSCSSFQPVVHVLQTSLDCPLWSLPWPVSPLLHCLKKLHSHPAKQLPSPDGFSCLKTVPASRVHIERGSGFREDFSEPVRNLLMGEISLSNPSFPVQRFLTSFLRRRGEHLQQYTASDPQGVTLLPGAPASAEPLGGKRKRVDEGEGVMEKEAKKQRSSKFNKDQNMEVNRETKNPELEAPRRSGRGRRRRQQTEEEDKESLTPVTCQTGPVIVVDDSPMADNPVTVAGFVKEDVLWTEKYQPQHSSDIIGNTASVRRLHSWLKEWKLRADRDERKKQKRKKQEDDSNDSWDPEEGDCLEGEEMCNTLLITGPTGVGKTAAVYACALELGFKVFEVNASSQRNGRQILSQLKEATQSHQVDIQGVNANKPCYFNSASSLISRPGSSPRKLNSPGRVVSSPRKSSQSPRRAKKGCLAPIALANFFKMGRPGPTNKKPTGAGDVKKPPTAASKRTSEAQESSGKAKESQTDPAAPVITKGSSIPVEEQSNKTATSLILFEEVDVIFDDDTGFLAAIKTFMTTTKRPVILTTSDPNFSTMFDGYFEEIHFQTPPTTTVSSYLQLLCLAENMRLDTCDISSLLHLNGCDIRQSLMHLQFWSRSAGGHQIPRPVQNSTNTELQPTTVVGSEACEPATPGEPLPCCDVGCTESILGLLNIESERDMLDLLKGQSTVEPGCWELLTISRRRGLDLLYSNMEALLPLPTTHLTVTPNRTAQEIQNRPMGEPGVDPQDSSPGINCLRLEADSSPRQPSGDLPPHPRLQQVVEGSDTDGSPVKVSSRRKRKIGTRVELDPFYSDSDSDDTFLSLRRPQSAPQVQTASQPAGGGDCQGVAAVTTRRRLSPTPEQRLKSRPVSSCLGSLAEFMDHMSLLDSCLRLPASPQCGGKDPYRTFGLRSHTETKDGMTDEPREECNAGGWMVWERAGEIQTAVEALSFQRCRSGVEGAWDDAQGLKEELRTEAVTELTLPVAAHRQGFRFTPDSLCDPAVLQRRQVMGQVMDILPTRVAGTLGNRAAAASDYLPTLRTICRSETLKEQGKVKRRFLHYLNAINLNLPKNTLQYLAQDFP